MRLEAVRTTRYCAETCRNVTKPQDPKINSCARAPANSMATNVLADIDGMPSSGSDDSDGDGGAGVATPGRPAGVATSQAAFVEAATGFMPGGYAEEDGHAKLGLGL